MMAIPGFTAERSLVSFRLRYHFTKARAAAPLSRLRPMQSSETGEGVTYDLPGHMDGGGGNGSTTGDGGGDGGGGDGWPNGDGWPSGNGTDGGPDDVQCNVCCDKADGSRNCIVFPCSVGTVCAGYCDQNGNAVDQCGGTV
jgi:hypothetical protein